MRCELIDSVNVVVGFVMGTREESDSTFNYGELIAVDVQFGEKILDVITHIEIMCRFTSRKYKKFYHYFGSNEFERSEKLMLNSFYHKGTDLKVCSQRRRNLDADRLIPVKLSTAFCGY